MYMCVYIYIYMHIHMYVCMYVYIYMHNVCTLAYRHGMALEPRRSCLMHNQVVQHHTINTINAMRSITTSCVCIYIYIYIERDVYLCVYIYIYIERDIYIYIYTHTYILLVYSYMHL